MAPTRTEPYRPTNHVRIVTAASLFDGHDAAINIMRRILQSSGAEVIHLGHNRAVAEIVDCAIQEDAQGIAITSYQGGHLEYLKYMHDLLEERGANIKIFAGGGGTILPDEIEELHGHGIERIYSPDDGREMGLQGMINDLLERSDFRTVEPVWDGQLEQLGEKEPGAIAHLISIAENYPEESEALLEAVRSRIGDPSPPVLGITGTGGSGKSSLVDEVLYRSISRHLYDSLLEPGSVRQINGLDLLDKVIETLYEGLDSEQFLSNGVLALMAIDVREPTDRMPVILVGDPLKVGPGKCVLKPVSACRLSETFEQLAFGQGFDIRDAVREGCAVVCETADDGRKLPKGEVVDGLKMDPVARHLSELLDRPVTKLDDCVGPEVAFLIIASRSSLIPLPLEPIVRTTSAL